MATLGEDGLWQTISRPAILGPLVLVVAYFINSFFQQPDPIRKLSSTLPIVGAKPGEWFPLIRARWRNGRDLKPALLSAYRDHGHEPCILPIQGAQDYVVLPLRDFSWYLDQPDSVIDIHTAIKHSLQLEHTVVDGSLVGSRGEPAELIKKKLTRETGNVIPELLDETSAALGDLWGDGTAGDDGAPAGGFREVVVYSTMQRAISRVTNRVFVGLPLCRDERLLDAGVAYAQDVPLASTLLRLLWKPLRPLAALFIMLPGRIHTNRFYAALRGEIQRRVREYGSGGNAEKGAAQPPNDFLQWSVDQALSEGDAFLSRVETMAGRLLLLNMAAIHTSSFSLTSALLDLAHTGPTDGPVYIAALREEIEDSLARHGGVWDKRALADMPRLDSVMRESARLNSFVTVATSRIVIAPEGLTTPAGTGPTGPVPAVHLPPGTPLATHGYAVMHDEEVYPDPETFRPFRFADKRLAVDERQRAEGSADAGGGYLEKARQAFTTTSPDFLGFGHGRHACPGRFFASAELRLMLAWVVMNYDFEFAEAGPRPRNWWFNINRVPNMKATIRVKRRT